jgi:hypothetical protein
VAANSPAAFEYAAQHHDRVSHHIDVDDVVAETFAPWRRLWQKQGHAEPMPR